MIKVRISNDRILSIKYELLLHIKVFEDNCLLKLELRTPN